MKNRISLFFLVVAVSWIAYNWNAPTWDERRISEHSRRCTESARDEIFTTVSSNSVNLHADPFPRPVGSANLPALDLKYQSGSVADKLLSGSDALQEVRLTFETPVAEVTDPKCAGIFSVLAKQPGDAGKGSGSCEKRTIFTEDFLGTYSVEYVYGPVDSYSIRSFDFRVVNRLTREVIAQQKQFQLLMGDMGDRNTRVLLGWGSSQGVRTCRMSDPANFIKRALGKTTIQVQLSEVNRVKSPISHSNLQAAHWPSTCLACLP